MANLVFSALFVLGIFLPTSIGGVINNNLSLSYVILLSFVFIAFIFIYKKISRRLMLIMFGINVTILLATALSPLTNLALGIYPYYLTISLLYCVNIKYIPFKKMNERVFLFTNIVVIIFTFLNSIKFPLVDSIILKYYSSYYPELVPSMLELNKPISLFASHSIAGFFFFLLFFMCFEKYKHSQQLLFLFMSAFYLYFMTLLTSNTSYIFFSIGLITIIVYFFSRKKLVSWVIILATTSFLISYSTQTHEYSKSISDNVNGILYSKTNGIIGRYGEDGNLARNIRYIKNNPFSPVGMTYTSELTYGDSAIIEYLTRGSIIMLLLMYTGLVLLLRRNLADTKIAMFILFTFLAFDIGYNSLTYFRTLYVLPFMIVMLNQWRKAD